MRHLWRRSQNISSRVDKAEGLGGIFEFAVVIGYTDATRMQCASENPYHCSVSSMKGTNSEELGSRDMHRKFFFRVPCRPVVYVCFASMHSVGFSLE